MTPLVFAVLMAAALDVSAPPGCLDGVEVAAAIDEIGGIDVAETVTVTITPVLDSYLLVVDVALVDAPTLHRQVPLRPRECADVADLVAVLVQGQRREALDARLRPPPPAAAPPVKEALPAGDPRRKPRNLDGSRIDVGFPSLCDGPLPCGSFRSGVSFGGAVPLGARFAADVGYDLTPQVTAVGVVESTARADTARASAALGLSWRTKIDVVELSARALAGVGTGAKQTTLAAAPTLPCDPDETSSQPLTSTTSVVFLQPTIAVRGRIGYVFVEAGGYWAVGLDDVPGAYAALGFSLFGP